MKLTVHTSTTQSAFRRKRRATAAVTAAILSGCLLFPTSAQAATGAEAPGSDSGKTVAAAPAPAATTTATAPTATATPSTASVSSTATTVPVPTATATPKATAIQKPAATAAAATEKTWAIYRSAYSATIYELVNGTTPTPMTKERWLSVYQGKTPVKTPTDYVRYAWSPTIYAVTYWPGGESARQWDTLTPAQVRAAGSPAGRAISWVTGSALHRWATSDQTFVTAPDGTVHALTASELRKVATRPVEVRRNEGFRRLSWAKDIVRFTDLAGGQGRVLNRTAWLAEGSPRPQVVSSAPGEIFHRSANDSTIWYTGFGMNRAISSAEWIAAGRPEVTVTPAVAGAAVSATSPVGVVDEFAPRVGSAMVRGWTFDPDTTSSILIDVYVDGKYAKTTRADNSRPDVGAVYPRYGAAHGFSVDVPMTVGTHSVCVYGINTGPGSNVKLACATVTIPSSTASGFPRASTATYSRTANTFTNNPRAAIQWPFLTGVPITDRFGVRPYVCSVCQPVHNGIDFAPGLGSDIAAIADGRVSKVVQSSATTGYGTYVVIDHVIDGRKVQSLYAHMLVNTPVFAVGDSVRQGDRVGRVGSTGSSTGAHLHFEVLINGVPVDPFAWLTDHNR